jgi:hypothetical protein
MARASTITLLSLDRFARIMGLNPAHFNGAAGANIMPTSGHCNDIWHQMAWQNADAVSREDLALAIHDAEEDMASVLGYYPAPKWIAKEMHRYPRHYRRDAWGNGRNVRGDSKSIIAKRGKFIQAGRRAVSLIDDAVAVTYSDPDGDGFNELATITAATSLTDACEIKVYTAGKSGAQEWEIRPAKSKVISGGNVTITFDAWQLINPTLWEALTTEVEGNRALDLTASIYVSTVDVYREYTDFSQASAEFSWEPEPGSGLAFPCPSCGGGGCLACENTIQTGCLHVRDVERGILVPTPGTYDDDEDTWQGASWTDCREPDTVKLWYRAGELDERYLRGETCEELSDYLAQAIAWLATARLERNICACNNAHALAADLRRDLAFTPSDGGSFILSDEDLANPFGTKKGEVMCWKRISKLTPQLGVGVSV